MENHLYKRRDKSTVHLTHRQTHMAFTYQSDLEGLNSTFASCSQGFLLCLKVQGQPRETASDMDQRKIGAVTIQQAEQNDKDTEWQTRDTSPAAAWAPSRRHREPDSTAIRDLYKTSPCSTWVSDLAKLTLKYRAPFCAEEQVTELLPSSAKDSLTMRKVRKPGRRAM